MNEKRSKSKKSGNGAAKASRSLAGNSPMDVNLLEQIVKLMAANDLNTVEVRDGDRRVTLKRGAVQGPTVMQMSPTPSANVAPSTGTGVGAASAPPAASEESTYKQIKSPMVGTFYSSSSPESKAFVSVGTLVDDDTDVCIIEAMKVFNNIKAECRGNIAKIMVENGQTVEFGQVLFLVKPS